MVLRQMQRICVGYEKTRNLLNSSLPYNVIKSVQVTQHIFQRKTRGLNRLPSKWLRHEQSRVES